MAKHRFTHEELWAVSAQDSGAKQAERHRFFDMIKPKGHWKDPIDCRVYKRDFQDCNMASIWFTGAGLSIAGETKLKYRVVAPGYYNTVGA